MSEPCPRVEDVKRQFELFKDFLAETVADRIVLTPMYRAVGSDCHWPAGYLKVWGSQSWGKEGYIGAGVYLHFAQDDRLLYVGKSVSIGRRLGDYFKHVDYPSNKICRVADPSVGDSIGVRVVPFADDIKHLTPALEGFLIETLNPPVNKQGKRDANLPD